MIHDALGLFSDAQAITAQAVSTSSVDLIKTGIDLGVGENLYVHVNVDTAFTDGSSDSTLTVELVTDDNASLSSPTVVQTLGTFPALSAIGARIAARIQPLLTLERYIGLRFTPNNGNLTTGAVTAFLTMGSIDANKAYPDNIVIS